MFSGGHRNAGGGLRLRNVDVFGADEDASAGMIDIQQFAAAQAAVLTDRLFAACDLQVGVNVYEAAAAQADHSVEIGVGQTQPVHTHER